jgi:hypothetical protein
MKHGWFNVIDNVEFGFQKNEIGRAVVGGASLGVGNEVSPSGALMDAGIAADRFRSLAPPGLALKRPYVTVRGRSHRRRFSGYPCYWRGRLTFAGVCRKEPVVLVSGKLNESARGLNKVD